MSPSVLIPRGNSLCQSGRAKVRGVEILLLRLTPSIILRIMNREETMCASFTRSQCLLGASVWSWAVGCRARAALSGTVNPSSRPLDASGPSLAVLAC